MKQKLFNLFPDWFKKMKHSDKIAHALLGLAVYLLAKLFIPDYLSLLFVCLIAIAIELKDGHTKGNSASLLDLLATVILPIIWYMI